MTTNEFSLRATAALALCAGTLATTTASWGQATFSNVNPIVINDSNAPDDDNEPASPFPSVIPVSGLQGQIAKITVRINAFSHNRVQDVNLLLRSPEGTSVYLLGDAPTVSASTNAWVTFDDRAAVAVTAVDPLVTGRYRPSLVGDIEIFPAPAPAGPHEFTLSSLVGEDPNGNWRLFVIDDSGPNPSATNEIVGSWAVEITTGFTFRSNDGPIAIPEDGSQSAADVYPSRIPVSGLPSTMDDCFVTLEGLNHGWSSDMDIVVRSPNGRTVTLISDFGGSADHVDATLVFEDSSLLQPVNVTGFYLPIDGSLGDNLPLPGPAGPYGVHLGRFSGVDPNGEWRLFCADDVPGDGDGTLEGWSITFLYPTSSFSSGGGGTCPGDADGDNDVDFNDLNLVLDNFADICVP